MIRALISFAVAGIAVIVQITIVDRIAFPGGTGPDVVLLAVAALALASGPLVGSLTGFWAGLALDVAPPGSHFVGQNALVFCLIGYGCGLAAEAQSGEGVPEQEHTALFEIVVTAVGAVCGETLASLLGVMLSDPRVTWPAVKHVLPVAVAYDVVLCPFVLYAVAAALRLAPGRVRERAQPLGAHAARAARPAGPTPKLRLAERGKGEGLGHSLRGQATGGASGRTLAKREPRLKLGHGGSPGTGTLGTRALGAAFAGGGRRGTGLGGTAAGGFGGGAAKVRFTTRRGEPMLGGAMALSSPLARSRLNGSRLNSSRFGRTQLGRSLLGGSVFSRSPSALSRSALRASGAMAPLSRQASIGRSAFAGHSPFLGRTSLFGRSPSAGRSSALGRSFTSGRAARGLRSALGAPAAGYGPRGSRSGILARLASALRGPTRPRFRLRPQQSAFRPATRGSAIKGSAIKGSVFRGSVFKGSAIKGSAIKGATIKGSAFKGPAIRGSAVQGKAPGRGWLRRTSGRGWTAGRSSQLGTGRSGPARLHMPRPKTNKKWRTGGYR